MPLFALTNEIDCPTRQPRNWADDDGCRRRQPENHSHGHKVYTF
jgi:hypothetical protein